MALNLNKSVEPPKKVEKKPEKKILLSGNLSEVLAAIRKSKGDKVVVKGHDIATVKRLPTGIFEFDFYIGGGFPCGRYSIVYGPESSCKTNVCLKAVANAQKLPEPCNKAIWVNIEQSYDAIWAEKFGVITKNLHVVNAGYGEEAIDIVDAVVRADDVAIVVVDSMAGLIASKEIAQSVENYDIGSSALLIKRMVNKLMIAFCDEEKKGHAPCVVLINQTRFKPGIMFGDPETMPGGEAQKFLASLRVRLNAKNIVDKALNTLMFKEVHAVIKKAKIPVRANAFDFNMCVHEHDDLKVGDTDSFGMVKSHLQALNLLTKTGAQYSIKGVTPSVFSTITAIQDKYVKDVKFQLALQELVLKNYQESMILVKEEDFSPVNVPPGTTEVVQSIASDDPLL